MPDNALTNTTQDLSGPLARMAEVLVAEETLDAILQLVVELAEQSLPGADAVSVSLARNDQLFTAAFTDEAARQIDEKQYQDGDGPCLDTLESGEEIQSFPLDLVRWPRIALPAERHGIRGVYALPLSAQAATIGVLNVYSKQETAPPEASHDLARKLARQASIVLANAQAYADAAQFGEQMQEALRTREIIGQAKGIIMARESCSADDAFDRLRRISQHSNVKLRDVAQKIVDSVGA